MDGCEENHDLLFEKRISDVNVDMQSSSYLHSS